MFDVCVIGHVTRDIVTVGGQPGGELPGGTAYYCAIALARLGLRTAVVTRLAREDEDGLLHGLRTAGVAVSCIAGDTTTVFENAYPAGDADARRQTVKAIAAPFETADLAAVRATAYHLGPLTRTDLSVPFLEHVARRGGRVSLDVQGFLRTTDDGRVRLSDWPGKRSGLARIDIVKADAVEAEILTGESDAGRAARALAAFGPDEAIVSLGRRGSLHFCGGRMLRIAAVRPRRAADPTGCGDTYMAGYLYRRLKSDDIARAGRFAAAVAALKLARFGPFDGSVRDVEAALRAEARCDT